MRRKEAQPEPIGRVIDNWFENKNYTQKRSNFDAFHNWADLVGKDIARNSEPVRFHKDVLVVKVRNSVWTQELQFLKPKLLEKIRQSFPDTKIRDILFRAGTIS